MTVINSKSRKSLGSTLWTRFVRFVTIAAVLVLLVPAAPLAADRRVPESPSAGSRQSAQAMTAREPRTVRIAGRDAISTAVQVSKAGWKTSTYVVIANSTAFADAIAGTPLAGAYGCPILLSGKSSLSAVTAAEIRRLKATRVFVLGSTASLSNKVVTQLKAGRRQVTRISANDRYSLAAAIAAKVRAKAGKPAFAIVVGGTDYASGLAASAVAARSRVPILMTARTSVPAATSKALRQLGVKRTVVVGATSAVSTAVERKLPGAMRIAGTSRYDTAAKVAEWALAGTSAGISFRRPVVASGVYLADSMAAGALGGRFAAPLLLTALGSDGRPVKACADELASHCGQVQTIYVVGATSHVSERHRADLAAASAVLIPETTEVLTPATMSDLESVQGNGAVLTFSEDAAQAEALKPGDVVVSGVTADTPEGLLRKVTTVQEEGGETVVRTTQATLEDAVGNASLDYHADLKPSDVVKAQALTDGVVFGSKTAEGRSGAQASTVFDISFERELYKSGDKSVKMEGSLQLQPSVDFSASYAVSYKWRVIPTGVRLQHLYSAAGLAETLEVNLIASYSIAEMEKEIEIARYDMAPVTVPCGPVPVVIQPVITVSINLKGEVSVGVETGIVQTASITAGLRYDHDYNIDRNGDGKIDNTDRWQPVWSFDKGLTFNPPTAALKVSAEAAAGPEIAFKLYGLAGPFIAIRGFLEFEATVVPAVSWDLYAGIGCYAGMKLEVLAWEIADVEMTIYEWKTLLWHGPPADASPPGPVTAFTATAGDAKVTLSWTNPSDSDYKSTRILRSTIGFASSPASVSGQTQIYDSTGTSYLDTGRTNGTRYYYTAFTRDQTDNWGTPVTATAVPVASDGDGGDGDGGGGGGTGDGFSEGAGYLQTTGAWTVEPYYWAEHDAGSHEHAGEVRTAARYEGSKSLYAYTKVIPPAKVLYDSSIPMGFQISATRVISPAFNAGDASTLELWMSRFTESHQSHWGWGGYAFVQFVDGDSLAPVLQTAADVDAAVDDGQLLRLAHEAPYVNSSGAVDNKVGSGTGSDGAAWSKYRVSIPASVNKASMRIAIVVVAVNWNSWGTGSWNSTGCYVDGLKLVP